MIKQTIRHLYLSQIVNGITSYIWQLTFSHKKVMQINHLYSSKNINVLLCLECLPLNVQIHYPYLEMSLEKLIKWTKTNIICKQPDVVIQFKLGPDYNNMIDDLKKCL